MNLNILDIMAPAFFELLILVGIHSYLGLHVIKRKVIFVDLALAQIAALGTTIGFLFGLLPGSTGAYWFSLTFTFLGAGIFSLLRFRNEKIPQEAIIGLTYAIAAAVAILIIDKAPHGAEHIKELLTGSILWVKWSTIFNAAIVYLLVGIFHYIFRDKFLLISNDPEKAYQSGMNVRFWDFLFYVSFGIVITHSVGTAGVLLVFVFLVVPAITAIMITDKLWKQLVIGWSMGVFVSFIGLLISYYADLPSGPTVVAFYGLMLTLVAAFFFVKRAGNRKKALAKVALGIAVILIVISGLRLMGSLFHSSHEEHHPMESTKVENTAGTNLDYMNEEELEKFVAKSNDKELLISLFRKKEDKTLKFTIAKRIIQLDKYTGANLMLELLKDDSLVFVNQQIIEELRNIFNKNFGYDPFNNGEANKHAIKKWEHHLHHNRN